jgi:hypothetical protein
VNKSVFIIPHFGAFKNYFQLFLDSCSNKKYFDFIIFTDNKTNYSYPENFTVHYMSFDKLVELVKGKFEFDISLTRPYKLCDLKPMYGYIFSDYIRDYKYWGYCDSDLIFGDLDNILTPIVNQDYDKIFFLGHCALIKNSPELITLFKMPLNGKELYKEVLLDFGNRSFDEEFTNSINNIFLEYDKTVYLNELEANIYMKSSNFYLTRYNHRRHCYEIDKKRRLFTYQNGHIFSYSLDKQIQLLKKDEYLYIHMQSREMDIRIYNSSSYKIIPNAFEELEYDLVESTNFNNIKLKNFNLHYFSLRSKNLFTKIKRLIKRN